MNSISLYVRLALAAALVAFGTSKLCAQLFLADWELSSAGHSDIGARGVFLLAIFLLYIAAASVVTSVVTTLVFTSRTGRAWQTRLIPGLIGSLIGAALVVVGADPTVPVLGIVRWESSLAYHVFSVGVALAVILTGVIAIRKIAHACRIPPAAV